MTYNDLIIWQYKGKPKAGATVKTIVELATEAFKEVAQIPELMNIDTTTGKALDLCGKRVGQNRVLNDFYPLNYFGFTETDSAKGFQNAIAGGGSWYRHGDPTKDTVVLTDEDYRFLIRCQITKNFQTGNMSAINNALQFIFNDAIAYDNHNMSLSVIIKNDTISDFKKYVIKNLDILPRPCGVGIGLYIHAPDNSFGFTGGKNVKGFNQGKFSRTL